MTNDQYSMRPEGLAIFRALYRPTTRGVRHRKVADDFVMRLTVLRGTNQVKVQKPSLFRKENDHPQIAPITQIP